MGISLIGDASETGIVGNILISFNDFETYEIAMNGHALKYIYRIADNQKPLSKRNVTIWYNSHMYPFVKAIGKIWIDGQRKALPADEIEAQFVPLETEEIWSKFDQILAEYTIARVGEKL